MNCLYCSKDTHVINSRPQKRLNKVWRRRNCISCGSTFTTIESVNLNGSVSVRSPKGLTPFLRDKIFLSIYESLKHRKTALTDATALTDTIISNLHPLMKEVVIEKAKIVEMSLSALDNFDDAAATHYRAFH